MLNESTIITAATSTATRQELQDQLVLASTTVASVISDTLPCYLVNNLTKNTADQCKFILDNNCLEEDGLIDYVYLVYCKMGLELHYAAMALIISIVIVLFLNLSSVADEFLCPSLLAVARNLRMSDSLAGVTLLAFGNGCPDIFSSVAAASSGRPKLIVGELLGAGIFCSSIVAGLVFISTEFTPSVGPLIRDGTFYLLAVLLVWYYCWQRVVTFYGALAFIIIYVIYLFVALGGQFIRSRLSGNYLLNSATRSGAESERRMPINDGNSFVWRRGSLGIVAEVLNQQKQLEQRQLAATEQIHSSSWGGVSTISEEHKIKENEVHKSLQQCNEKPPLKEVTFEKNGVTVVRLNSTSADFNEKEQIRTLDDNSQKLEIATDPNRRDSRTAMATVGNLNEWDHFMSHLNPIDVENWTETRITGKIIQLLRAPMLFLTILTVPVVDSDKRNNNWCRMLNSLHCFMIPAAVILIIDWDDDENNEEYYEWLVPLVKSIFLIPGLLLSVFVFRTTEPFQAPKFHSIFAYFGFAMSIIWIYLLANEIICLLKTVGIMFSMTDTAIGLGVLAWGNSLGDIVANLSLAEAGYPKMALGASIGAPLLNLLLGFGLAFTISLKPGQESPVEFSPTVTLLCCTLATILILLMLSTLIPSNRSRKPFGYMLIVGYGVYFMLAVGLECGLIFPQPK